MNVGQHLQYAMAINTLQIADKHARVKV